MSSANIKVGKVVFSTLLIITLIAPSVLVPPPVFAEFGDNESRGYGGEGNGEGEGEDGEDATAEAEGEAADAAAEAQDAAAEAQAAFGRGDGAAAQAAAGVARDAAGRAAEAGARAGTEAASQAVDAAAHAANVASSFAEAATAGMRASTGPNTPGLNTDDTNACGCVAGNLTGYAGDRSAGQVARDESDRAIGLGVALSDSAFNSRFGDDAVTTPNDSLSQALGRAVENTLTNLGIVAQTMLGVTPAHSNQATSITMGPSRHTTNDVAAFNAYSQEVAEPKAAYDDAWGSYVNALDQNDAAAAEQAQAAMDRASAEMQSVAQSHFGVAATSVSLAGTGGGTGTAGSGGGSSPSQSGGTGTTGSGSGGSGTAGTGSSPTNSNSSFTYDSSTNTFTGTRDSRTYSGSEVPGAGDAATAAAGRAGRESITVVDTTKEVVSNLNTRTGVIDSFKYDGTRTAGAGQLPGITDTTKFTPSALGGFKVTSVIPTTPSTDLATGRTSVGTAPDSLQGAARARGYNLSDATSILALGYVYEIDARTRANIVAAYEQNGDFSDLSDAAVIEVAGILNAIAGEASRKNRTVAEQIAVPYYLTSVTVNEKAFDTLKDAGTREALSALAGKLTDGSMAAERGLEVAVPVSEANHFYAAYANPSWASAIANPTEIGQYTRTIVGYIPSEINPTAEGARAAAVRSPALVSGDSVLQSTPALAVTTKTPTAALLAADLEKVLGIETPPKSETAPTTEPANPFGRLGEAHAERLEREVVPENYNTTAAAYTHPNNREGFSTNVGFRSYVDTSNISERMQATLNEVALSIPNTPLSVTSGFRSKTHNAKVKGAKASQHMRGNAVDVSLNNLTEAQQKAVVDAVLSNPNVRGFGYYTSSNSIHFDVRESDTRAYWGGTSFSREGFDKAVENETIPGWMSTAVYGWKDGEYAGISGAAPASGRGAISPTTPASTPSPTARATDGDVIANTTNAITEQTLALFERLGIPRNNPIVQELTPMLVKSAITMALPFPARVAIEIARRNGTITGWFQTTGPGTITNPPENEGENPCPTNENDADCQPSQQGASVWFGIQHNELLLAWLDRFWPSDTSPNNAAATETTSSAPTKLIVTITINAQTGEVELSREDLMAELKENIHRYSYGELMELVQLFEETPLVFSDTGSISYSNGLFAPLTEDGYPLDDTAVRYVYITKYIDENGLAVSPVINEQVSPDNLISKFIRQLFSKDSAFDVDDVETITYHLIDPDINIPQDAYYDYTIRLKNGDVRSITIPEYTSITFMKERFSSVGYQGEAIDLVSRAHMTEVAPSSIFDRLTGFAKSLLNRFTDTGGSADRSIDTTTLPTVNTDATAADVDAVFIYPLADVDCPVIDGLNQGFAYSAVIKDKVDPDKITVIADARCGQGDADSFVEETSRHLSQKYGIAGLSYSNMVSKTLFRFEPVIQTTGVFTSKLSAIETIDDPVLPDDSPEPEPPSAPTPLPNLTNDITFEVKAVGSQGQTLLDWTTTPSLTIGSGVQLYFRWNGTAYQQCLPFLNDSGNYALTVKNQAMVSGNTETERYDVREASTVYRIECGGQRNNEFGVDAREVEVVVQ